MIFQLAPKGPSPGGTVVFSTVGKVLIKIAFKY
jgi:hypothetical protein